MKTNRFNRSKEVVDLGGFSIVKLGSLQLRERTHLLNLKKKALDQTQRLLDLAETISKQLDIPLQESWKVITEGLSSLEPAQQITVAPMLLELRDHSPESVYIHSAVVMLLQSRLENLAEINAELNEAFNILIPQPQAKEFDKVPFIDRLESKHREQLSRTIVDSLPEEYYELLVEFVSNEERQWKTPEPSDEPDPTDPK